MQTGQVLMPDQFVQEVEKVLPVSTPQERKRLLEHETAWAVVSYAGHVPKRLARKLQALEERYGTQ